MIPYLNSSLQRTDDPWNPKIKIDTFISFCFYDNGILFLVNLKMLLILQKGGINVATVLNTNTNRRDNSFLSS